MARLSSQASGTDVTVEPRLISRPVNEMTDEELLAEATALRGMRGVTTAAAREAAPRKASQPKTVNPGEIDEFG